jgi:hypothetical protein
MLLDHWDTDLKLEDIFFGSDILFEDESYLPQCYYNIKSFFSSENPNVSMISDTKLSQ